MSPLARPFAAAKQSEKPCTSPGFGLVSAAEDLRSSPLVVSGGSRVSRRQLETIQDSLTALDQSILHFVQEVRLATGAQLRRRFWPGSKPSADSVARTARRALARLGAGRVLDRLPGRQIGGQRGGSQGYIWHVGPVGLRLLERQGFTAKRLATPGDRYLRHALGLTELLVRLFEADRAGDLELIEAQTEPACWRGFIGTGGGRVVLKPDLFVRVGAGRLEEDRWFVEWDNATEARSTLEGKLRRHLAYQASGSELAQYGGDPRVLWAVPGTQREELLWSLVRGLQPQERELFAVTTQARVISFLAQEARS